MFVVYLESLFVMLDEWVLEEILPLNAYFDVLLQQAAYQVKARRANFYIRRNHNAPSLYGLLEFLSVLGDEGRHAYHHFIQNDAKRPQVSLLGIVLMSLQLGCHVDRCAADRLEEVLL
jgi:hypothetical protein